MGFKFQYRDEDDVAHPSKSCLPSVLVRKRSTPRIVEVLASSDSSWGVQASPTITTVTPRPLALTASTPSTGQETYSASESHFLPSATTSRWAALSHRSDFAPVFHHSTVKDFNLLLTPPTPTYRSSRPKPQNNEHSMRARDQPDLKSVKPAGQPALDDTPTLKPRMRSFPFPPESPGGTGIQKLDASDVLSKTSVRLTNQQSTHLPSSLSRMESASLARRSVPDFSLGRPSATESPSSFPTPSSSKGSVYPTFSVPLMLASPQPPPPPPPPRHSLPKKASTGVPKEKASTGKRPLRQEKAPKKNEFQDLTSYISSSGSSDSHVSGEYDHSTADHDVSIMESADALNCLAVDHIANGDFENALSIYEHILKLQQERFGENHPSVAGTYHNLGIVYAKRASTIADDALDPESQHHRARALACFQSAARVARDSLGPSHPNVAVSLVRIGLLLLESKQYLNALTTFKEALRLRMCALGSQHRLVANVYNNMGLCCVHLGRFEEAKNSLEAAASIHKRVLQSEKCSRYYLELADTLFNLGGLCLEWIRKQGFQVERATIAMECFEEVLKIRARYFSADSDLVLQVKALLEVTHTMIHEAQASRGSTPLKSAPPAQINSNARELDDQGIAGYMNNKRSDDESRSSMLQSDASPSTQLLSRDDSRSTRRHKSGLDEQSRSDPHSTAQPPSMRATRSDFSGASSLKRGNSARKEQLFSLLVSIVEQERASKAS